ncbi:MAG: hypothetical protein JRE88_04250 [Deltaproteobacteria bacterium]|nr:hypothetical protein [Deltaproteobacteria bacterium]
MADKTKNNNLDSEIAKRLDDLFGEGDSASDDDLPIEADDNAFAAKEPPKKQPAAAEADILDLKEVATDTAERENVPDDYPLAELKNLVLSIDWEITDETLASLVSEIDSLKKTYRKEKIVSMFLQLLASLGQYIKTNRGNAHPKTFKILNSVFSRLEEVILTEKMTEADKKNLLRAEMQKYKQLRNKVSQKKAATAGRKVVPAAARADQTATVAMDQKVERQDNVKAPSGDAGAPSAASLAEAVKELKQFIHSELNALKQELKKLQKVN